jgi:predicted nucleic acid-binding protein
VLIVDASQALAWLFADERSEASDGLLIRVLAEQIIVPEHWRLELANGALAGERRRRSTADQTARWLDQIDALNVEIDNAGSRDVFERILPLARAHGLTIYDTLYLELAERRGLPLATLDRELAAAGRAVGVEILE